MTGPGIRNNRKDGAKQTGGSPAIHPYNALNPLPGAAPLGQPHRGDDGDGGDGNPAQPISRSLPPWGVIAACSEKARVPTMANRWAMRPMASSGQAMDRRGRARSTPTATPARAAPTTESVASADLACSVR